MSGRPVSFYVYRGTDHTTPGDRRHAPPVDGEPWHGTAGGYTNHRCRCVDCTEANAISELVRVRRYREHLKAAGVSTRGGFSGRRWRMTLRGWWTAGDYLEYVGRLKRDG